MIPAQRLQPRTAEAPEEAPRRLPRWGVLEYFIVALTLLPGILYFPGTQPVRMPIRVSLYGLSLLAWAWRQGSGGGLTAHPARRWLAAALLLLGAMIFHPTTNSFISGLASVFLYFSVMAPVFWAPGLVRSSEQLKRILWILLICNGLNSFLGLLQVYQPERFMPLEMSDVVKSLGYGATGLTYTGANGQQIIRPTGLSDAPGAVAAPGMTAALLGLIFCAAPIAPWYRLLAFALAFSGLTVIYLTWVRSCLIILSGMLLAYVLRLLMHRFQVRSLVFAALTAGLFSISYKQAIDVGGKETAERFATLLEDDPMSVYYKAKRGDQLETAFTHILQDYPFGAGLGRWGMMYYYFADQTNLDSPSVWAELQFPAWIYDGGFPLMFLYCMALVVSSLYDYRLVKAAGSTDLQFWSAAVLAHNIGILGFIFSYTPFTFQLGMQYWLLAGVAHGAHCIALKEADEKRLARQR